MATATIPHTEEQLQQTLQPAFKEACFSQSNSAFFTFRPVYLWQQDCSLQLSQALAEKNKLLPNGGGLINENYLRKKQVNKRTPLNV